MLLKYQQGCFPRVCSLLKKFSFLFRKLLSETSGGGGWKNDWKKWTDKKGKGYKNNWNSNSWSSNTWGGKGK